ncbi:uncharacterized protein LOC124410176 [Diprion similis]|uniref:uncharacterized protein LOC124410176 n=1 Tax=Diprion similis TaxID=362088 RepID=UPI001EF893B1|nr:uncharacterized protein LOC124410176 [Diprion similis]
MDREVRLTRMHRILTETGNNFAGSARTYRERFPEDEQPPSRQSFRRLAATEAEHGVLKRPREQRIKPVVDGPVREEVENAIRENGRQSLRRLARTLQVPRESVRTIVKGQSFYPYKHVRLHKLCPGDDERRLTYCRWGLDRLREDPDFYRRVCHTDEAIFTNLEISRTANTAGSSTSGSE